MLETSPVSDVESIVSGSVLGLVIVIDWPNLSPSGCSPKVSDAGVNTKVGMVAAAACGAAAIEAKAAVPMSRAGAPASAKTGAIR